MPTYYYCVLAVAILAWIGTAYQVVTLHRKRKSYDLRRRIRYYAR